MALGLMTGWAQVEARYDKGNVEVVNGRVMFRETIATTLDQATAFERINRWAEQRFSKPNVIVSKFTSNDATNHSLSLTAEEYIVFTKKFFVLDRTRINYWVEIQCGDGAATIKLTRINYWYEEERDGGIRFSAEEFITDEQAFNNKGKMRKDQGKFRKGTIDFFDNIMAELTEELSIPAIHTEFATATSTEQTELPEQTIDTTTVIADNNNSIENTTIEEANIEEQNVETIQFPTIYFAFNSIQLTQSELYKIQEIASKMKANDSINIRITGWCDPVGSEEVNKRISRLRAKAVMQALEKQQISTERIKIVGGGVNHDAPNHTEARIATIEEFYCKQECKR